MCPCKTGIIKNLKTQGYSPHFLLPQNSWEVPKVLNVSEYQNSHEARVWKELLASLAIVPFLRVQHVVALTKDENLRYMTEDVCSFEAWTKIHKGQLLTSIITRYHRILLLDQELTWTLTIDSATKLQLRRLHDATLTILDIRDVAEHVLCTCALGLQVQGWVPFPLWRKSSTIWGWVVESWHSRKFLWKLVDLTTICTRGYN